MYKIGHITDMEMCYSNNKTNNQMGSSIYVGLWYSDYTDNKKTSSNKQVSMSTFLLKTLLIGLFYSNTNKLGTHE